MTAVIKKQPTRVTCGQTCVAMLARVDVDESMRAIEENGRTSGRQIISGLARLGVRHSKQRAVKDGRLPRWGIVRMRRRREGGHWVVKCPTGIIDPGIGMKFGTEYFLRFNASEGRRPTSYIEILGALRIR